MPTPNTARAPPHRCPAQVVGIIGEAACFPNYQAVLPQSNSIVFTIDAAGFRKALARVSLLAPEQSHGVCLALERGQLTLSTAGGDAGEAVESMDAAYSGEPCGLLLTAAFCSTSLAWSEADTLRLPLKDNQSAAELRPADPDHHSWRYVVMPMRL